MQGGCQIGKTKKHVPNEKTEQTPEKILNKMEASSLPDAEFKTLVIKMLNELRGKIDDLGENFKKI